ncbi:MAG: carbohydrate-binding domain-containing protein, partial [Clostridia bacterium]|nr:carbohydrate-binding domain-containing protein [Clostridia bacterium]
MRKLSFLLALLLAFSLAACGPDSTAKQHSKALDLTKDISDLSLLDFTYSNRDTTHTYSTEGAVTITLDNESTKINGGGAALVDGDIVITKEGTYILSGKYTLGMLKVECSDTEKVQIVLNGAEISSPDSPAVYVKQADKVFFTLAKGTENKLVDGDKYSILDGNSEIDATLFSRADTAINGEGKLTVIGTNKHGIISKDDLVITGGEIDVRSKKDAIVGKDCVKIGGGNITLNAGSDGLISDNNDDPTRGFIFISAGNIDITAEKDGIQSENAIRIDGGNITVKCGGGSVNNVESLKPTDKQPEILDPNDTGANKPESYKAIKADVDVIINGGTIIADTADVCLQADGSIVINGGAIKLSSGENAVTAGKAYVQKNGALYVTKAITAINAANSLIEGGEASLICSAIGINATASAEFRGGYLITDTGLSAVSTADTFLVSGATVLLNAPADEEKPVISSPAIAIAGGHLMALGNT